MYASWRASAMASVVLTPVLPFPFLFFICYLCHLFLRKPAKTHENDQMGATLNLREPEKCEVAMFIFLWNFSLSEVAVCSFFCARLRGCVPGAGWVSCSFCVTGPPQPFIKGVFTRWVRGCLAFWAIKKKLTIETKRDSSTPWKSVSVRGLSRRRKCRRARLDARRVGGAHS